MARNNVSKRSKTVLRLVRREIDKRLEKKSINVGSSSGSSTSGVVGYISPIPQSNSVNGRSGDVIRPNLLELRFSCQDPNNINYYRILVVRDNMNQGTSPAVTDVLSSADTQSAYHYVNVEQQRRFTIVFDKTYATTPVAQAHTISKKIPLGGTTHFVGTDNTVSSAGRGSYFLIHLCQVAGMGQSYNARINFTDA